LIFSRYFQNAAAAALSDIYLADFFSRIYIIDFCHRHLLMLLLIYHF